MHINIHMIRGRAQVFEPILCTNQAQKSQNTGAEFELLNEFFFL